MTYVKEQARRFLILDFCSHDGSQVLELHYVTFSMKFNDFKKRRLGALTDSSDGAFKQNSSC
jgi:hypothetical protein